MASSLLERFEVALTRDPDRTAVIGESAAISRRELADASDRIAAALCARLSDRQGGAPRVVLAMEKSWDQIAVIVACLKARITFVPISIHWPIERQMRLLELARPSLRVSHDEDELAQSGEGWTTVRFGQLLAGTPPPSQPAFDNEIAYIMFTSGSTGTPKGVQIPRSALEAFAHNIDRFIPMPDDEGALAALADPTFDMSIQDWVFMLLGKGTLHLLNPHHAGPGRATSVVFSLDLVDYIDSRRLTYLSSVGTMFSVLLSYSRWLGDQLSSLRYVCSGGSALFSNTAKGLLEIVPQARLFNLFGPTEATVYCGGYEVTTESSFESPTMPIGRPFDGQQFLYDTGSGVAGAPPEGELAEMLIAGTQLMTGYVDGDSFETVVWQGAPVKVYRSGDLFTAKRGDVIFVSRKSGFIKTRGHRVSPVEVENAIAKHPEIIDCAAVDVPHPVSENILVLYYVSRTPLEHSDLEAFAGAYLASYMIPEESIRVEAIPKNSSSKTDYVKLRRLYGTGHP